VKDKVNGTHTPISNEQTVSEAASNIDSNREGVLAKLLSTDPVNETEARTHVAEGIEMMKRLQEEGNHELEAQVAERLAEKGTALGQGVQAYSLLSRLSPEGVVVFAQRQIKKANEGLPDGKKIQLKPEVVKDLVDQAKTLQTLPDGEAKVRATAKMMKTVKDQVPPSLGEKISAFQAIMQLLNPKTVVRNLGGNLGLNAIENVKDTLVATPLDMATSLFTGKRSKAVPSLTQQISSGAKGLVAGAKDAMAGIDTSSEGKTALESTKGVFSKTPVLRELEKGVDLVLNAPDRAFFDAARDASLREQMRGAKVTEPTEAMAKQAHLDALYRTLKDDNVASRVLGGVKKALNKLGTKDGKFGMGDLVVKYTGVPGSLLSKSIDYSPAGFIKTAIELTKPLVTGEKFNQRQFVEATSRAITGSAGLVGTGALLHRLGIIVGDAPDDKDIAANQRAQGFGSYRLNLSALQRFVFHGFQPQKNENGDHIINYDWLQPAAVSLAMGANIDENHGQVKNVPAAVANGVVEGSNTIVEQPVLQGLQKLFKYGDLPKGIAETISSAPASFVPSLLNQFRQLTDNTSRNVSDPNLAQMSLNQVKNRIPYISKLLPENVNVKGETQENYQNGSNNIGNVFVNPGFLSTIEKDPVGQEVMRMYEESGETDQAPRVVPKSIKINGENHRLTGQEQADLQRYVGTFTQDVFSKLVQDPDFSKLEDSEKAKVMANVMSDVMSAGKIQLLGDRPKKPSARVLSIIQMKKKAKATAN
jgi:hypothetical protein